MPEWFVCSYKIHVNYSKHTIAHRQVRCGFIRAPVGAAVAGHEGGFGDW